MADTVNRSTEKYLIEVVLSFGSEAVRDARIVDEKGSKLLNERGVSMARFTCPEGIDLTKVISYMGVPLILVDPGGQDDF